MGVDPAGSRAHKVYSRWACALGLPPILRTVSLPVGTAASAYRECVAGLSNDQNVLGVVITSHKTAIVDTAHDLIGGFTELAGRLREAGVLVRRQGALTADAPDVASSRRAVGILLSDARWAAGDGDVIIFGAGGAGRALAYALSRDATALGVRSITLADCVIGKAAAVANACASARLQIPVRAVDSTPRQNGTLLARSAAGTLIVNATGLGKDAPGSPVDDSVAFPSRAIVWDFNYRGERRFLRHARTSYAHRDLRVEDGRNYFVAAWTEALARIAGSTPTDELYELFDVHARAAGV